VSPSLVTHDGAVDLLVVGGSAGAVETLVRLLASLPPAFAVPIAVVVHLPRRRASALSAALAPHCRLRVSEVQDKEPLRPGCVHVAPPDYHLLVDEGGTLALSVDPPVRSSIPSIDVLFESAALVHGPRVAGLVLSGANDDGADGLRAIADAGGVALVHAPEECAARTMPERALARCPRAVACSLADLERVIHDLGAVAPARRSHG
jgi:two-component system chemotaxis response regulator CheB